MSELQFARQFLTTLDNKSNKYDANHVFNPQTFQMPVPYTLPRLSHPAHPLPPRKSATAAAPGSEIAHSTINLVLKSARNPNMNLTISSIDPITTTIQSLKEAVQIHLGGSTVVSLEKIKILWNKKPVPASKKTIAEAVESEKNPDLEFGVMVMGGAPDPPPQQIVGVPSSNRATAATEASGPESEKAAIEAIEKEKGAETTTAATAPVPAMPSESTPMADVEMTTPDAMSQETRALLKSQSFWEDLSAFLGQRLKNQMVGMKLTSAINEAYLRGNIPL